MSESSDRNRRVIAGLNGQLSRALEKLNYKQRAFVLEYGLDFNGIRAVKSAGYSGNGLAGQLDRLLKNPDVKHAISIIEERDTSRFTVQREEVLMHLYFLATRTLDDFYDEDGNLITNPNDLNQRAKACVDSIKQKTHYGNDGNVVRKDFEYKISPKSTGLEMAMRHKGLFAAEKTEHTINIDFSLLANLEPPSDSIENRIEVEGRVIPVSDDEGKTSQ